MQIEARNRHERRAEQSFARRKVLRPWDTAEKTGYSAAHLRPMEREGTFPKKVQLGPNAIGWFEDEVDAWLAERAAARDAPRAA